METALAAWGGEQTDQDAKTIPLIGTVNDPTEFVQDTKTAYDRLFEISPLCNQKLITRVKKKIEKNATEMFQVPNYLNGWSHTTVYKEDDEFEDNSV